MKKRCFIKGDRVYLRGLELEDIEGNYPHWFDDAEICEGNSHHCFPYSYDQLKEYIEGVSSSRTDLVLAIVEKENHTHIGNISLQNINNIYRSAEFAIVLGDRDYMGMGISKEAAKLIIEHGFKELNLNRVYCGTFETNVPMIKLAKFLNMKQEGIRRSAVFKNSNYIDMVEFGLLKEEYQEMQ